MSLNKLDIQLFMKRLRKRHPKDCRIKYYVVGEYGGITMRPHYHYIIFNCDIDYVVPAWNKGNVHFGTLTHASVGYTLKYMTKASKIPLHKNDDRVPEFSNMSKGLGSNYITDVTKDYHTANDPRLSEDVRLATMVDRMYLTIPGGKKIAMPRYYKDKLYDDDFERPYIAQEQAKLNRLRKEEAEKKLLDDFGDDYVRVQAEFHQDQFKKMHKDALKNRNL